MNINGKWMSEPEVQAYVSELEDISYNMILRGEY